MSVPDAAERSSVPARSGDAAWLGIDLGTQGVRCVVLDDRGARLGVGTAPLRQADVRDGDRHEQDPQAWWDAVCASTTAALAGLGGRALGALAIDATSGTILVESAPGVPAGPALMYDDARAAAQAERAQQAGAELWAALGYRMQTSWALPKALWLVEHAQVAPGARIVHQADHIAARLTGTTVATDSSHALKTGVDLRSLRWPSDVFDRLGLPTELLPDVVRPGTHLGVVCEAAAQATGIPAGTAVRAGMTDGCAAQISARSLAPGAWSSALGTTLVIKGSTLQPVHDPSGAVYSHLNPDGGWLPGGASSTGSGVIARDFAGQDLDALTASAAAFEPVLPAAYPLAATGERFPFVAAGATGFGFGDGDAGRRFAAVIQGIALVERLSYAVLGSLGADVSGPVTLSGGATANRYWNQLRADILGRPALVAESVEAAVGMAVLAAAPAGQLAATAERMVRIVDIYHPDPERGARFDEAYHSLCTEFVERGWLRSTPADAAVAARS